MTNLTELAEALDRMAMYTAAFRHVPMLTEAAAALRDADGELSRRRKDSIDSALSGEPEKET